MRMQVKEVEGPDSSDRVARILERALKTTMIGALASLEKEFGFLWNHGGDNRDGQQDMLYHLYQKVRGEILDRGNLQIKKVKSELALNNIKLKKFNITLPIKERK